MSFQIIATEVDGVPTFWVDAPGPYTALLSFRVGSADEPASMRGISHLVEHLALGPLGIQDYDHNGSVEPIRTQFVASGSPDEVVRYLDETARGLGALPTGRILTERAVLRREAAEQGPSIGSMMRWYRYGSVGHGGVHEDEHGTAWLGEPALTTWTAARFTRENAVLVLSGPPPTGLRLPLPAGGRRWPAPEPRAGSWVGTPAAIRWEPPVVTMTLVGPRTTALSMGGSIYHRRLRSALRFTDGLVYDIGYDYDALDATTAHVLIGTEAEERDIAAVTARMLEVWDRLIAEGPTADELAAEVSSTERAFEHTDGRLGFTDFHAFDVLIGSEAYLPDDLLSRRRAVTAADVQAALASAGGTMLLGSAAPNPSPDRLRDYPMWSHAAVVGTTVSPAGFFLPGRAPKERLTVGADGVTMHFAPAEIVTIRYADVVAAVHEGDVRLLVGADGHHIVVNAEGWKQGKQLVERIDQATPAEAFACAEHSPGGLADPEGRS